MKHGLVSAACGFVLTLAVAAAPASAEVTLINAFEVPEGQLDETIEAWEAARDFLSAEPGYVSTALHQAMKPDATFQLINVAIWESPEAFMAATARMRELKIMPPIDGLRYHPALYTVIRTDAPVEAGAGR